MNVWAYKRDDFYTSPHAPACTEGNVGDGTVPLRPGELRWDRMLPFDFLADLVTGLRSYVQSGDPPHLIEMLAIMAHGMPGGVRIVPGELLNFGNLSTHGPRLRELNEILHGGGRRSRPPLVLFMSCTAAAPPDGTRLFEGVSGNWMPGTRIIGFRTRLAMAGVTPREVGEGRVCLPPDLRVTDEAYDPALPITAQGGGSGVDASTLPIAQPRAHEAREFLDGRLVWEAEAEDAAAGSRGAFLRPTETHRGRGGGPRLA